MEALNIPAIRGILGDIVYYTSSFTFKQIAERVKKIDQELHTSTSLKDQLQRSLTKNYESITDYILSQKEHFFNALVLAVYDGDPVWNEIEVGFKGEDYYNMGFLRLNGEEKIFPVDGQHRVEGIKDAIKKSPELEDETIAVILIGHHKDKEGMEKTRRIFSTLNRYAKPVSTGDIIALDEDDTVAIVTRNMLESFPLFMNENISDEKKTKAIVEKDTKSFTSLIKLYETNKIVYKYYTSFRDNTKRIHSSTEIDKFLKFRPKQEDIDDFEKYLTEFWELFINSFEGMKEYVASTEKDAAAKYRNRENGGLLYFRPVALPQLVTAILETCFRFKVTLADSMSAYSQLEMCISKAPWVKVLWDAESRTMIMKNKTLVRPLLMFMYDRSVLNAKELESLRIRYAKVLEIEPTEIDDKLNALESRDGSLIR
jgi:DNA sulfur modification protein DndB